MLLVHHRQAQPREPHAFLDEGMGADRDVGLAGGEPLGGFCPLRPLPPQLVALQHAEAMLLVHHREPEAMEAHAFLQ